MVEVDIVEEGEQSHFALTWEWNDFVLDFGRLLCLLCWAIYGYGSFFPPLENARSDFAFVFLFFAEVMTTAEAGKCVNASKQGNMIHH